MPDAGLLVRLHGGDYGVMDLGVRGAAGALLARQGMGGLSLLLRFIL